MAYRPLTDLKESSTTIATDINDLPTTSPHGSYSEHDARNLGFATDPNATRGTATAHRDTCCNFPRDRLDHCCGLRRYYDRIAAPDRILNFDLLVPNQEKVEIQVLHLVSLRDDDAFLSLSSLVPKLYRTSVKRSIQSSAQPLWVATRDSEFGAIFGTIIVTSVNP
jgi:hypothetical protein